MLTRHHLARPQTDALAAGTPYQEEATAGLAAIAQVFVDHPGLLMPTLHSAQGHRLPVQALGGIPHPAALQVGMAPSHTAASQSHAVVLLLQPAAAPTARSLPDSAAKMCWPIT